MTRLFLDTLARHGFSFNLVERRFSLSAQEVGKFRLRKVLSGIGLLARLFHAMRTVRPKAVILFSTTQGASFLVDWLLSEILRRFPADVILYIHTIGYSRLAGRGRVYQLLVRRLLGSAQEIVVLSSLQTTDVNSLTSARIHVIPNTLPDEPLESAELTQLNRRGTVLFLSNLTAGKGYKDFLHAARHCIEAGIAWRFVLAGAATPTVAREIEDFAASLAGLGNIEWVGPVSGRDKWDLFHSTTIFVFPSHREALPLVVLEAAACGLPILGYNVGGLAPVLSARGAARLVDRVGDRHELAVQLLDLATNPDAAFHLAVAAKHAYQELYSKSTYHENWLNLLGQYSESSK